MSKVMLSLDLADHGCKECGDVDFTKIKTSYLHSKTRVAFVGYKTANRTV